MLLLRQYLNLLLRVPGDGRRVAGLLLMLTFGACMEALGIGLIMPFIALLQRPSLVDEWPLLRTVTGAVGITSVMGVTMFVGVGLLLAFVVKNLYIAATTSLQMRFLYNRLTYVSRDLLASYLSRDYTFFLNRNSTELVKNVVTDASFVFYSAMPSACLLVIELLTCVVLCVLLVALEPVAVPVVALAIGGGGWLFQRLIRRRTTHLGEEVREREKDLAKQASQAFGGFKEVRVRGCEPFIIDTFTATSRIHTFAARKFRVLAQIPRFTFETLAVAGMVLVALIVLARGDGAARLVPLLGVMALAVVRMMPSAVRILGAVNDIRFFAPTVAALHEDLSLRAAIPSKAEPLRFERQICLEDVSYAYPGAAAPSLLSVSLRIEKGEAIALVGSSGAGKTTLADVLIGLLQPTSGRVVVDGTPLDVSNLRRWQRLLGYVPQNVYLCDDTLRRNIAFGVPDAEIDEERLERALEIAQLGDLVASLSAGLDTQVGERGVKLSGGQRQRIGIARALYFDPKVLVLDEATSALDGLTEAEVVSAIESARSDRTTIVIAHRLSTVRGCDRIVYMAEGRISNVGTWDNLVASNSEFRRLVELGASPA